MGNRLLRNFCWVKEDIKFWGIDALPFHPACLKSLQQTPGKYIGELARLLLVSLHRAGAFCPGQDISALSDRPGSFLATDVSAVEEDTVAATDANCRDVAKRFGLELSGADDLLLLRRVCAVLTHRGALLVGLVLAALLRFCLGHFFKTPFLGI